jgi:hypothetical protein
MAASHVLSLAKLAQWTGLGQSWWMRFGLIASLLGACWTFLYYPLRQTLVHQWATPILIRDQVIMVNPRFKLQTLQRGDVIAYQFEGFNEREIHVASGGGLDPILALPGDDVQFMPGQYRVHGLTRPALPLMPTNGVLRVPEMHWFLWPHLGMIAHGSVPPDHLQAILQKIALIPGQQIIGQPYQRWLGRRQVLP